MRKQPTKAAKDTKLHTRFDPVSLKSGEELIEPKTLNSCKFNSGPKSTAQVCSPTVLNNDETKSKIVGSDRLISPTQDVNGNTIRQATISKLAKKKLKSPNNYVAPMSHVPVRKPIDAETVLEMMQRKLKSIKRRSVQAEFCSVMKSMEQEMSLAPVAENPDDEETVSSVSLWYFLPGYYDDNSYWFSACKTIWSQYI